jgi:Kef-type K+ transport system membrane component KefB
VGGIILGPGILGAIAPRFHQAVFNPQVVMALNGIAWWGVMIFVFLAGIELDLSQAWKNRKETAITATLALGAPLLLGSIAALLLLNLSPGWMGPRAALWQTILGTGMACAVTALPILVLLLERLNILETPLGQRTLRYASLDDVAIWGVLALILTDWQRLGRQAAFIAIFALLAGLIRKVMKSLSTEDRWVACLLWLITMAFTAEWAGLHFMVGAFLAGLVIDSSWFEPGRRLQFRNAILLAMMPVFFLSTGLRTTWDLGGTAVFAAAGLLLLASISGKLAGIHLAGRLFNWPPGEAGIIGWLLQTKALIMIIFANILLDREIISSALFTALLLMAIASTLLTVPIVRARLKQA